MWSPEDEVRREEEEPGAEKDKLAARSRWACEGVSDGFDRAARAISFFRGFVDR